MSNELIPLVKTVPDIAQDKFIEIINNTALKPEFPILSVGRTQF
jgi:hypothetical protein